MVRRIRLTLALATFVLALTPVAASAYTITSGIEEGQSTNATSITIDFYQPNAVTVFCKLDEVTIPCAAISVTLHDISEGEHKFEVGGTYNDSICIPSVGCSPIETPAQTAQVNFSVDRTDPVVSIVGGPAEGSITTAPNVSFGIASSEGSLACRFDGAPVACDATGVSLTGLSLGKHELVVESTDRAGNSGGATRSFTVVGSPTITSAPKSVKQGRSIALKLNCPEGCEVKGVLKLGSKKLKLKDAKSQAGFSTVTFRFNKSQKKAIKSALKRGKKVSVVFTPVGGVAITMKIKK